MIQPHFERELVGVSPGIPRLIRTHEHLECNLGCLLQLTPFRLI